MKRPYRRRRILVDELQYRLLGINLFYFLVILLLFAAFLFTPLALQLGSGTLSVAAQEEAAGQFLTLHKRIWPALLITFGLLAIHSVLVSHRIAGPLYQFRKILKALRDGDLTVRAAVRSNDYLRKEEALINEMIETLRARIKDIDEQSGKMRAGLGELEEAIGRSAFEKIQERIVSLEARADGLQAFIDQFTTGAEEGHGNERVADHAVSRSQPGASAPVVGSSAVSTPVREREPQVSGTR